MIDLHGRNINKLRISLTEVCNMACTYCVTSLSDHKRAPDELSADEMLSLVRMLKEHAGIVKVRLTGGEPLLYPNLIPVVSGIREMGISSIGLTTNGQLLARKAKALVEAGLKNVNLSLDSLDPENFKRMGRVGKLRKTLEGVEACLKYDLKVKVNMVVVKGENDDEIVKMLEYGVTRGVEVRYLELMAMGPLYHKDDFKLVTMHEILEKISARYSVQPVSAESDSTSLRYWVPGGYFGIIPNNSAPFCSTCSRLRLTSNGQLIGCLSNPTPLSIRHLLDHPDPEETLQTLVKKSISYKQDAAFTGSALVMSRVGG
ncbi:MAG: GTP 3',8-cyclase MoaA [SAR324 cluster bacterium]|jgi:cyclic pyranopterin phosphate synthase|nr:GTP 3',8-cyclase MoaA [SAR324 cluster bacterium]